MSVVYANCIRVFGYLRTKFLLRLSYLLALPSLTLPRRSSTFDYFHFAHPVGNHQKPRQSSSSQDTNISRQDGLQSAVFLQHRPHHFHYPLHFYCPPLTIRAAPTTHSAVLDARNNGATTAFTDPVTNISFQRFFGAKSGFAFGIALPQSPNDSFIGQMSFPLASGAAGWGGWSLTSDMKGPLLMAAWASPDGQVLSSFRQAANEDDNPPEVTGKFSVRPIASGTSVNGSFLTYTFLCQGCLDASFGLGATDTAGTFEMGWALGDKAVGNPGSSAAVLNFHNVGFGGFDADLQAARFADFDAWAALASPTPLAPSAGATAFAPGKAGGDDDDDDDDDKKEGDKKGGDTKGGGTGDDSDDDDD